MFRVIGACVALLVMVAGGAFASEPAPLSNTVRWSTASEVDIFGFDVYRNGCGEDEEFSRLTEDPILAAGASDSTTRYEWTDATIEAAHAYCYYVERIRLDGHRDRFTPVIRAKVKDTEETDGEPSSEAAGEETPGGD